MPSRPRTGEHTGSLHSPRTTFPLPIEVQQEILTYVISPNYELVFEHDLLRGKCRGVVENAKSDGGDSRGKRKSYSDPDTKLDRPSMPILGAKFRFATSRIKVNAGRIYQSLVLYKQNTLWDAFWEGHILCSQRPARHIIPSGSDDLGERSATFYTRLEAQHREQRQKMAR